MLKLNAIELSKNLTLCKDGNYEIVKTMKCKSEGQKFIEAVCQINSKMMEKERKNEWESLKSEYNRLEGIMGYVANDLDLSEKKIESLLACEVVGSYQQMMTKLENIETYALITSKYSTDEFKFMLN